MTSENEKKSEEVRFENPFSKTVLLIVLIIFSFFLILGVIGYYTGPNDYFIFFIMWGIASLYIVLLIYREFIHRPTSILVGRNGLNLIFRNGRSAYHHFLDIAWVDAIEGEILGKDGMMKIKNQWVPYPLTYELAQSIRCSHLVSLSYYPMTREEFRKNK